MQTEAPMTERSAPGLPGLAVLLAVLGAWAFGVWRLVQAARLAEAGGGQLAPGTFFAFVALIVGGAVVLKGLFVVQPNEAKVLQLFGRYQGSARVPGLRWANPFYSHGRVSLRTRNFETSRSKVNDAAGNPIEIAAVVVWHVKDSAEAMFQVDNYENFVQVQSESALRQIASRYPYDGPDDVETLRGDARAIADHLKDEIQERLARAGVRIVEARFSHLAYAPEIAAAMLQRQQAAAMVAARRQIVEGAVGMVEDALGRLAEHGVVHLDDDRKAQLVCNLMVVLCSERGAQPVVSAS